MAELNKSIAEFQHDGLITGAYPHITTQIVEVAAGEGVLPRGTVLGRVTGGKYRKVNSASTDGSEKAKAVLMNPVDASSNDVKALVFWSGCFNPKKLIFGGTDTADQHEDELRKVNIIYAIEQ